MNPFSCGQTRREFVWQMGGGFTGLALTSLLSADGFFNRSAMARETAGPLTARASHLATKAKACIFLMMNGAPSQVDTFDYKPVLEKYAGKPLPPGKNYINSGGRKVGFLTPAFRKFRPGGDSGLLISDYFPNVRKHADKLSVIRSCHTDSHAHGSALVAMNTGKTFIGRPSLGSWCVYGLGTANESLPGYVVILDKRGGTDWRATKLVQRVYVGRLSGNSVSSGWRSNPRPSRPETYQSRSSARSTGFAGSDQSAASRRSARRIGPCSTHQFVRTGVPDAERSS